MIGVVDYGLGNVRAFENIYRRLGVPVQPVRTAEDLNRADRFILPGVGAFDWAMTKLKQSGMIDALNHRVIEEHVPVLGVCVGMQIMAKSSEEGSEPGLCWIPGRVERFRQECFETSTHLPHMGWNDVRLVRRTNLFSGLDAPIFYFLHSYCFSPTDPEYASAFSEYGSFFASAVERENIFGVQFHPEKSHEWGVQLLKNFAAI